MSLKVGFTLIVRKVENKIDDLVNWNANIGGKSVYSVGYFKEWARKYNVSL